MSAWLENLVQCLQLRWLTERIKWCPFMPSDAEAADGMLVKNACRCRICGANADRYQNMFRCQANPGHVADTFVGIFSDLSYPKETAA